MTRTQHAELQPRPHRQFQFATAAVVAVVILATTVVVGGTVLLRPPDVGPAVVSTASPTATTTAPAPTPTPLATPGVSAAPGAVLGGSWQRVNDPDITGLPMGSMYGVMAGGPGAIAWGEVYGTGPRIWTTTNGRDWTSATVETPTDFDKDQKNPGAVLDVTAGGPGYVAVGVYTRSRGQQTAIIWTSTDGTAWQRVPDGPVFADANLGEVVAWKGELFAFGCASCGMETGPTQGWASKDGIAWTRFTPTLPVGSEVVASVSASADRLWATGGLALQTGDPRLPQPLVRLTSLDGRTWTASALPGAGGALHALPNGLYLTVSAPTTGGAPAGVYRSMDATTWTALSVGKPVEPELVAVGDTLLMVGGAAWRSTDGGLRWDSAPITGAVPASVTSMEMVSVAALPDGTLVAVGTNFSGKAATGLSPSTAAWVSLPTP